MKGPCRRGRFAACVAVTTSASLRKQFANALRRVRAELSGLEVFRQYPTRKSADSLACALQILASSGEVGSVGLEHQPADHATSEGLARGAGLLEYPLRTLQLSVGMFFSPDARCVIRAGVGFAKNTSATIKSYCFSSVLGFLFHLVRQTKTSRSTAHHPFSTTDQLPLALRDRGQHLKRADRIRDAASPVHFFPAGAKENHQDNHCGPGSHAWNHRAELMTKILILRRRTNNDDRLRLRFRRC